MRKRVIVGAGIAILVFFIWKKGRPSAISMTQGRAMGCEWKLVWKGGDASPEEVRSGVAAVLEHWEQVLSQWRPDSDLSRTNRGASATPDLARVLSLANDLQLATDGAFDPRLLSQVHAAGFGPAGHGYDLSSLGKGFAVDRVGEMLSARGIRAFNFSLAGEVLAGEGPWPVGIESPDPAGRGIERTVTLSSRALATSGNSRQWRPADDGKLISHIIDPRTGNPVIRPPCSVTVVGSDAATASAWATALFVLGPGESRRAEKLGLQVIWLGDPE